MKAWALKLIFFTLNIEWVRTELFSATVEIEALMYTHGAVIDTMEKYLEEEEHRLEVLSKYLNQFKKEQEKMERDDTYVFNPINAFSLIHTLTEDFRLIKYYFSTDAAKLQIPNDLGLPLEKDLSEAAIALKLLQNIYALNVTLLAAGNLTGNYNHDNTLYKEETSPLSVSATFHVGRVLYLEGEYNTSLRWLHEALNKYNQYDQHDPYCYDDSNIIDYIRNAYHGIDDYSNAIFWTKRLIKLRPWDDELHKAMGFYYNELKENVMDIIPRDADATSAEMTLLTGLCRGKMQVQEDKKKDLHCHYKSGPHPYLRLAPIKTELLHRDPDVYLFYDVITDAECDHFRLEAQSKLKRAEIYTDLEGNYGVTQTRTSKTGWLNRSESPVVDRLSRRVATLTGLSLETAEPLQVANYGIGGHYGPHYDFIELPDHQIEMDGDRIATVMFYMSEVELGGATVFLQLNLTVFPIKNAALFWSNLLPSGEHDYRLYHAACPVLRGSKWACNQWIDMRGQELIVPCGLEYQENYELYAFYKNY